MINNNYYFNNYFILFQVCGFITCRIYKILSLSRISTPTPLDDLNEYSEHPWKTEDDEEDEDDEKDEDDEEDEEND
jgi:hypothetical protein